MHSLDIRLETERLILRVPTADDLDGWARLTGDARATLFLGGSRPRPAAWRGLCTVAGSWALYGYGYFSVIEKASGNWIGRVGPWRPEGWPVGEFAAIIASDAQGRGIGLEAAEVALRWTFDQLGWAEVVHFVDARNTAALRTLQTLGAKERPNGFLPPRLRDRKPMTFATTPDDLRRSEISRHVQAEN